MKNRVPERQACWSRALLGPLLLSLENAAMDCGRSGCGPFGLQGEEHELMRRMSLQ